MILRVLGYLFVRFVLKITTLSTFCLFVEDPLHLISGTINFLFLPVSLTHFNPPCRYPGTLQQMRWQMPWGTVTSGDQVADSEIHMTMGCARTVLSSCWRGTMRILRTLYRHCNLMRKWDQFRWEAQSHHMWMALTTVPPIHMPAQNPIAKVHPSVAIRVRNLIGPLQA